MQQNIVVITGATRGIGRHAAHYFARQGYTVVATGRNRERLDTLETELEQYGHEHAVCQMDVTRPEEIDEVVQYVVNQYGHLDVWINNAGAFAAIGPTWEVDAKTVINDLSTNIFGPLLCIQSVVPILLRQDYGCIINLVGGGTVGPFPYGNGYGTSKTAVARLTENLAAELANTSIKVFALDPGLNDTDMTRYQRESTVGKRYLPHMEQLFEEHADVPPNQAPQWMYYLAEGQLDAYIGRVVSVYDDLKALKEKAQHILENDLYTLRLSK
ncbi:SDR family NAD(P)-dependent oxidoreductase [Pullulanibacillus camelliae]|nr:SDR family oxidoreductase [Pullulanibacillus camelliae]